MAAYRIRPFEGTAGEYEAVVVLQNLVEPKTNNEEHNPMHGLNLQLGFEPQPADLDMEKVLIR